MNQNREENGRSRGLLGAVVVVGVLWVGWLSPWWAAHRVAVGGFLETARLVVWWLALGWVVWIVPRMVWGWWSRRFPPGGREAWGGWLGSGGSGGVCGGAGAGRRSSCGYGPGVAAGPGRREGGGFRVVVVASCERFGHRFGSGGPGFVGWRWGGEAGVGVVG